MVFFNLILVYFIYNYYVVNEIDLGFIGISIGYFYYQIYWFGLGIMLVNISIILISGIVLVGFGVSYQIVIMVVDLDFILFVFNFNIQFGDEIKYVFVLDFGGWIKCDIIVKIFGVFESQFIDDVIIVGNWIGNWGIMIFLFVLFFILFMDFLSGNYVNNIIKIWSLN